MTKREIIGLDTPDLLSLICHFAGRREWVTKVSSARFKDERTAVMELMRRSNCGVRLTDEDLGRILNGWTASGV